MANHTVNNADALDLIWETVKYIGIGILSIISMFFLWLLGKYRSEHEQMYLRYVEENGTKAKELAEKHNQEFAEIIAEIKEMKHQVNQLRQNQTNIGAFAKQLERIEDDVHELKGKI